MVFFPRTNIHRNLISLWRWLSTIYWCYFFTVCVNRKAVRPAVQMISFVVITTSASRSSGCVMVKKTARWGKMRKTARKRVQNDFLFFFKGIVYGVQSCQLLHRSTYLLLNMEFMQSVILLLPWWAKEDVILSRPFWKSLLHFLLCLSQTLKIHYSVIQYEMI